MTSYRARFLVLLAPMGFALAGCYRSHQLEEPLPQNDCPAALLAEAPVPMPGYCPTRSNRTAFSMPDTSPELRWMLALEGEPGRSTPVIVGPSGRLYQSSGSTLTAIDDVVTAGRVAWRVELGERVFDPVLLDDGSIFVVVSQGAEARDGVWLDTEGRVSSRVELPPWTNGVPIVGPNGTLFFVVVAPGEDDAEVIALSRTGSRLWSRPVARYASLAIGAASRLIVAEPLLTDELSELRPDFLRSEAWLLALDVESGAEAWRVQLDDDGIFAVGPSIGPAGSIYTVLLRGEAAVLVVRTGIGSEQLRLELGTGFARTLTVDADGTAYVWLPDEAMAVTPSGDTTWRRERFARFDVGATLDGEGLMLESHRAVESVDGRLRWESEVPVHRTDDPDGGWTLHFPELPIIGDGVLYYMASDDHLYAVGSRAP